MVNGAMRFDAKQLTPLYELEIGKPGSSFALEIAKKIGFSDSLLKRASTKVGHKRVALDQMLLELEAQKQNYEALTKETERQLKYHSQYAKDYSELKALLDLQTKQILTEAKVKAKQIVGQTNQKIEQTIREIKENQADKEITKSIRQGLQTFVAEELAITPEEIATIEDLEPTKTTKPEEKSKVKKPVSEPEKAPEGPISVGSYVKVEGSGVAAKVIAITGKDAEVSIGDLKSKVKLSRLTAITKRYFDELTGNETSFNYSTKGININERMAAFSFNLDLRGKRGSEALTELDQFLDSALLLGQQDLKILHGKGDGILRNLVRQHLKAYKQVASVTDEHADRGGDGITLVSLK